MESSVRRSVPSPKVSVVVTAYNYGRFLPDCIESVLAQDFGDYELVVCDDCSTDDTEEVLARYAAIDPRIRVRRNDRRLGMNGNLKHAAEQARGEFIKVLCADDWLTPDSLSTFVALMERFPSAVMGTSACIYTNEEGVPLEVNFLWGEPSTFLTGPQALERVADGHGLGGNSSFFIRRDAYHRVGGYDAALLYAADFELAIRLCQSGDYVHVDRPLFYGRHQASASSVVDPGKLFDVYDYLAIPGMAFKPRPVGGRNWWLYQRSSGRFTIRFLINSVTSAFRGRWSYSARLAALALTRGNLLSAVFFAPGEVAGRLLRRLTGAEPHAALPPEDWMGPPQKLGAHQRGR